MSTPWLGRRPSRSDRGSEERGVRREDGVARCRGTFALRCTAFDPAVRSRTSKPSCPMSSRIASARRGCPPWAGYQLNSRSRRSCDRFEDRRMRRKGVRVRDIHATRGDARGRTRSCPSTSWEVPILVPACEALTTHIAFVEREFPERGYGGIAAVRDGPRHDIGRETNRGVGRRRHRGCRALGSVITSPRGRRRGRPRRPRETDLQFEAFPILAKSMPWRRT